ncbi:DUF3761 domain-containing protein [Maribellus sp. YY47]|uniref:DUF3761 domain-containing protein n=1 Tax=Maribellus sp. YY47 TaxID=2929486 RepID=UPI0020013D26|nr:DUF3761 domain-containing protein [Maribellus sp. YY47]MCK3683981.1 DUF3761 domain-containing protein [Maribellus sp. YY47]
MPINQIQQTSSENNTIDGLLLKAAKVFVKYDLYPHSPKQYFIEQFPFVNRVSLNRAWDKANNEITYQERIKFNQYGYDKEECFWTKEVEFDKDEIIKNLNQDYDLVFDYLINKPNSYTLKARDKRAHYYLALGYITNISEEIKSSDKLKKFNLPGEIEKAISYVFFFFGAVVALSPILIPFLITSFTPSDKLVLKYLKEEFKTFDESQFDIDSLTLLVAHEHLYRFNGAVCNDGSISHSQGRGTCSYHGGVSYYFYKGDCMMTWDECQEEAIKLLEKIKKKAKRRSWID